MEYIRLGKILKSFGLDGEVRCFSLTSFPKERFKKGTIVSLLDEATGDRRALTISKFRDSGQYFFLAFAEVRTIEEAELLKGRAIEIEKDQAAMPKGYVRLADLISCQVYDPSGKLLGTVADIQQYSPVINLVVETEEKKKFYVPFVDVFVKSYDLEEKRIVIQPIGGML